MSKRNLHALLGVADYAELEIRAMAKILHDAGSLEPAEGQKPLDPAEEAAQRLAGTFGEGSLDKLVSNLGLVRMPGESDEALRARAKVIFQGGR